MVHCRISIVYPRDYLADWELWIAVAAQHHERVSYHILLAWGEIKMQNLKSNFY